jgi:predicted PurR-regulated permease PerM
MMGAPDRPRVRRRSRAERRVTYALKVLALVALAAVMLFAVLQFVGRIGSVAVIVFGAIFFTYAIYPVVKRLNRYVPLGWSIAIVYLGIGALAAFAFAFVVPALYDDVQSLAHATPSIVASLQAQLADPKNPLIARLPDPAREYLAKVPQQLVAFGERYGAEGASRVLNFLLSIFALVATVVIIPVLSIYLMIEEKSLIAGFMRVVPEKWRPEAASVLRDLDAVLGGFIRGQILVGIVIGAFITVALLVLHVKYAVLIGVAGGIGDIIPYVGAFVGFVPAVILAFVNDGWQHALVVTIVFIVIFQLEGHFIAPKIVSDSVGLSPLTVIVAILIGGELLGVLGMFVAVPVAGILRVALLHALPRARAPLATGAAASVDAPPPDVPPAIAVPAPVAPKKARGARA